MNKLFFCGGMPRSCSTLLMNILQENPRIFTTTTCPLPLILRENILISARSHQEFKAMALNQADAALYGLVHGAAKGWFEGLTDKPVVISKHRSWSNLMHIFPQSKHICLLRDLRDIAESVERLNVKYQALHDIHFQTFHPALTEEQKFSALFNQNLILDSILNDEVKRLIEIENKRKGSVLFIRCEDFLKNPVAIIHKIYSHIDEEYYDHDLQNIQKHILTEHDGVYIDKIVIDHSVDSEFKVYRTPERKLSKVFHDNVVNEHRWYYDYFYPEVLHGNE